MIQFQCEVCGGFLRAEKQQAGETISCNLCGADVEVPDTSFEEPPEDIVEDPDDGSDDPFADLPPPSAELPKAPQPADFADAPQPSKEKKEESDSEPATMTITLPDMQDPINRKLLMPSFAVLGSVMLSMFACILYVFYLAYQLIMFISGAFGVDICALAGGMIWTIFSGLIYSYALSRSVHLVMRTDYDQARIATILAMLPCGPCCMLSLPAGIWAFNVLRDDEVRDAFDK